MIGPTLSRYLMGRFAVMILAVFAAIFSLVYVVDFVEMLRRAGDVPNTSALFIAYLSLLRTPSVSEQVLPFCVLFGAMTAFMNLTRKLELLVARAVGISVWQFMIPPVAVAAMIGIMSVALYNPVSATMKQRADGIENRLFGKSGTDKTDNGLWIRQKSVDGQSILRADGSRDGGRILDNVTAYVYDTQGRFLERVDAAEARLLPGVWQLDKARLSSPGEEGRSLNVYLLATNLAPDQVAENFVTPDSVPFWDLPGMRAQTEMAGLDATGYRLQFQTLLARPLLLVAMVMIAAAFSLRFFRFGGIAKMVCGGLATGLVLFVATKFVGDLGGAGLLSAPIAAWSPAVVGTMLGTLALLNQEDG